MPKDEDKHFANILTTSTILHVQKHWGEVDTKVFWEFLVAAVDEATVSNSSRNDEVS